MSAIDKIVEEIIRAAMEAGEFENLPGAGKPLKLEDNPYEPEGMGTAYRLLKNNGVVLPWMEEGQAIDAELDSIRQSLQRTSSSSAVALELFRQRIEGINRRILRYNLSVPAGAFQRNLVDVERELARAGASNSPQE